MLLTAAAAVTVLASPVVARAGCLTGAAIGGVAGHMVHHGVLGAAAGCAVGHHHAVVARRREDAARNSYNH
jgi:hypothetical protein